MLFRLLLQTLFLSCVYSVPVEPHYLISLGPEKAEWMTQSQLFELYKSVPEGEHLHFVDMTEGYWDELGNVDSSSDSLTSPFPSKVQQTTLVQDLKTKIETDYIVPFLKGFTSFNNRYYTTDSGGQSALYLYDELLAIKNSVTRDDVVLTVSKFEHSWKQFSIIARLEPKVITKQDIVVLGGHQDSINRRNPTFGRAPGVDDDASGVVNNLSVLQVLYKSTDFVPVRPIEFHFYAGEEAGLKGSQEVVGKYTRDKILVYAMLQSDMTGYKESKNYAIITDYVNSNLVEFLKVNAAEYVSIPTVTSSCGYGCSDHASWNRGGYPSSFHFEDRMSSTNPKIHSESDDLSQISIDHMLQFMYATIGFAVELSLY
jgi:leucyl aminopeptidase